MSLRLAVLITYHDEKQLLTECLSSILGQKDAPDEVLVFDDASTFPASEYVPADPRVRVLRIDKNRGPAHARNALREATTADYIHFHDADDWFHPEWATRIRSLLDSRRPQAIFTEVSSHQDGRLHRDRVVGLSERHSAHDFVCFAIHHALLVPSGTYERSLVDKIGGYREALWQSEDYDFHVRLALAAKDILFIDEPLVHIRLRAESRSTNHLEVWSCRLQAVRLLSKEVPDTYQPELGEAALAVGSKLYRLGAKQEAKSAFRLGSELCFRWRFEGQSPLYQRVARSVGPEAAEWLSQMYRDVIPTRVRELIRKRKAS